MKKIILIILLTILSCSELSEPNPIWKGEEINVRTGEKVEMTAEPNPGFVFSHWTINGIDTLFNKETVQITVNEDLNIIANFKK